MKVKDCPFCDYDDLLEIDKEEYEEKSSFNVRLNSSPIFEEQRGSEFDSESNGRMDRRSSSIGIHNSERTDEEQVHESSPRVDE